MSAAEIIELIKKLPPAERAAVVAFVKKDEGGVAEPQAGYASAQEAGERKIRTIPQAEAEHIADRIFDQHAELFRKLAQ